MELIEKREFGLDGTYSFNEQYSALRRVFGRFLLHNGFRINSVSDVFINGTELHLMNSGYIDEVLEVAVYKNWITLVADNNSESGFQLVEKHIDSTTFRRGLEVMNGIRFRRMRNSLIKTVDGIPHLRISIENDILQLPNKSKGCSVPIAEDDIAIGEIYGYVPITDIRLDSAR